MYLLISYAYATRTPLYGLLTVFRIFQALNMCHSNSFIRWIDRKNISVVFLKYGRQTIFKYGVCVAY